MIALGRLPFCELGEDTVDGRVAPRVLVVEDDGLVCTALCETLAFGGYRATGVRNGREAMRLVVTETFDAVVTDIVMPHVDGLELIMHLRRLQPALPVIAISGDSHADPQVYLRIARHLGVNATMTKPFGAFELFDALTAAFSAAVERQSEAIEGLSGRGRQPR